MRNIKEEIDRILENPKPKSEQDTCEHEVWINLMRYGCRFCIKCGKTWPITDEDLDNI